MTAAFDSGQEDMHPAPESFSDDNNASIELALPDGAETQGRDATLAGSGNADGGFGELADARAAAERILGGQSGTLAEDHEGQEVAAGPREVSTVRETFTPQYRLGVPMEADVVPGLPPEAAPQYTSLGIGGEKVELAPEILRRVVDTTREAYRLGEESQDAFCDEFAALLCGGTYNPTRSGDRTFFGVAPPRFEYDAGAMIETAAAEADDDLPTMQPIEMGKLEADGTLDPVHTIVKLPGAPGLYVGKLGEGPVVISGLSQLAAYYETTHCVPIARMSSESDRFGSILDYTHPSYDPAYRYTVTRNPLEHPADQAEPEAPAHHERVETPGPAESDTQDPWL